MKDASFNPKYLILWIFLALFLATLPYLWVTAVAPPGQVFTATLINPDDTSVYLSAIRQGQEGNWLFNFQFTPEAIAPKFMYMPYLLLGHLEAWVGGGGVIWFHVARLVFGLVTLLAVLAWVRVVLPEQVRWQASAWFLIVFGGGFGWLVAILTDTPFKQIPELGLGEWGVIMPLMGTPHFALGLGLMILFMTGFALAVRTGKGRWWWGTAVIGLLLGLTYSFQIPVLYAVVGVYLLALMWQRRAIPWRLVIAAGLVLAPMLPLLFYYGFWATRDELWAFLQVQHNVIPSPSPLALLLSWGLIAPLAVAGGWRWLRERRDPLTPVWAIVQVCMLYLPLPYAGRFLLAVVVPVGTLAGYGLEVVVLPWLWQRGRENFWQKLSANPYASLRRLILILTLPSTLLVILFLTQVAAVRSDYPLFLPEADAQAVDWLADHTTADDVVLADYPVGNYLPGRAAARVFAGQYFLTLNMEEKLADVAAFWQPETTAVWREQFLADWGITLVYAGTYEQALGATAVTPPGRLVYDQAGVKIYDVRQP